MRAIVFPSLLLSSTLVLGACAGYTGSFKGSGKSTSTAGKVTPTTQVKTVASKEAASGITYTELGIAKGKAPTAQEAVDQAKFHCGKAGGNLLILNTDPYQSGNSWIADATCATDGTGGGAGKPVSGTGKPAR